MFDRSGKGQGTQQSAVFNGRFQALGDHIRMRTLIALHGIGMIYMTIFSFKAIHEGMCGVAIADALAFISTSISVYFLIKQRARWCSTWAFLICVGMLFLFLLITGGSEGSGHLWLFGYPIAAVLLLQRREGMVLAVIFLACVALILLLPRLWEWQYVYPVNFKLRLFGSLILVFIIALTYELVVSSAAQNIAQQDRKYRALYDNVPIGLYQASSGGELVGVNRALAAMFGCESAEQMIKEKLFVPGIFSEIVSRRFLKDEQVHGITRTLQRRDGAEISVRENVRRAKRIDEMGMETTTFEGSLEDISMIRNLETRKESYKNDLLVLSSSAVRFGAATRSSDIYRIFAELAGTIIGDAFSIVSIYDADAGTLNVSDYYVHPCYIEKLASLLGDPRTLTMPVDDTSLEPLRSGEIAEISGGIYELSFGAIPPDICTSLTKSLDLGRLYALGISWQREVYGSASFIMRGDQTLGSEKREALETLGRQAAVVLRRMAGEVQIRQQHSFISILMDTIPIPVFFKDREGRYMGCNRAFEKFTGKDRDFLDGKTVWDMAPPEIAEEYARQDNELFSSGTSQRYEWKVKRGDGELRDVKFYKGAFYNEKGEVAGLVGTFTDITEEKALLKATVRARDEAEKAAQMKMRIMSSVTHEMRTPLTAIMSLSELVYGSAVGSDGSDELILMRKAAGRLMDTVDNIIALTGLEAGILKVNETQFDVVDMLKTIDARFAGEAREKGLRFFCKIPEKPLVVAGDNSKTAMVLRQLVSNAVKFTDSGEVRVSAEIQQQDEHTATNDIHVLFTVTDTGPGIAEEIKDHIFEVFFQADQSVTRKYGGAGLGLPVTEGLTRLLGGTFEMKNNDPKGTMCMVRVVYKRNTTNVEDTNEEGA
ncbi:MAG: PAS domain S-box protein [Chitinivibrionales bacterium]|nr:PAS domain S-box protein [Chitinivibrionales bacterium]